MELSLLPCRERVEKVKEMFSFDLLSAEQLRLQVSGLYKHSEKVQIDEKNMLTWLILNKKRISEKSHLKNCYQKGEATSAAQEIAAMANKRQLSIENIKSCLNKHGIEYIEVEKIEKAPIDAYSTLVDGQPFITVTYRYNDMDKLAFDILHELCHIDRHLDEEQMAFIAIDNSVYSTDPREREANEFARQSLIPDAVWNDIMKKGCKSLSPYKIIKTIAETAESKGISPSIAVARYKHDTNWYNTSAYKSPKIS